MYQYAEHFNQICQKLNESRLKSVSITALDMVQSTKRSISSLISRFKELMNGQI